MQKALVIIVGINVIIIEVAFNKHCPRLGVTPSWGRYVIDVLTHDISICRIFHEITFGRRT